MTVETHTATTTSQKLKQEMARLAGLYHVPGVAVGVYLDGEEYYACHGLASIADRIPVDEETLFQIGSTAKTFTASALMCLVEQGKISLEDQVIKHLPELRLRDSAAREQVQVRHLLNHTAGWNGDFFEDTGDGDDALAIYVRKVRKLQQLFPPGSPKGSYNNAAVAVAGRIIEKITRKSYEQAVLELLLEPIGLDRTFFFTREIMTYRYSQGYLNRGENGEKQEVVRPWKFMRAANPMGGLSSTVKDQIKWARFHLGDGMGKDGTQVLTKSTLELMKQQTARMPITLGDGVGLSWLLKEVGGVTMVGHGGTTIGQLSAFQLVPERDFAITILTNSTFGAFLHRDLLAWGLETYIDVKQGEHTPLELTPGELQPYTGKFRTDGGQLTIKVSGDHLELESTPNKDMLKRMAQLGMKYEKQPPTLIKLLPEDVYLVIDGRLKGMLGEFVREDDVITGAVVGGRLAKRVISGSG